MEIREGIVKVSEELAELYAALTQNMLNYLDNQGLDEISSDVGFAHVIDVEENVLSAYLRILQAKRSFTELSKEERNVLETAQKQEEEEFRELLNEIVEIEKVRENNE